MTGDSGSAGSDAPQGSALGGLQGNHFELCVQTSFAILMLTNGCAPELPPWPISKVRLQTRAEGYLTDDVLVTVSEDGEERRLLGQIKLTVAFVPGNPALREALAGAWGDFKNPKAFTKGRDVIALITGPLSEVDTKSVRWLLRHAKSASGKDAFFRDVLSAQVGPSKKASRLEALRSGLARAKGEDVSDEELYDFLQSFVVLSYDFGVGTGVVRPLLNSHILNQRPPSLGVSNVWDSTLAQISEWNGVGKEITREDVEQLFPGWAEWRGQQEKAQQPAVTIPENLKNVAAPPVWSAPASEALVEDLAKFCLIGQWVEGSEADMEVLAQIWGTDAEEVVRRAQGLRSISAPLQMKNGYWNIPQEGRVALWKELGAKVSKVTLDRFKAVAVRALREVDAQAGSPVSGLFTDNGGMKRGLRHSAAIRRGLAEGLALLGNCEAEGGYPLELTERLAALAIREIFEGQAPGLWWSLGDVLPILAEASPIVLLNMVEMAQEAEPWPFASLSKGGEGDMIVGSHPLPNLVGALEILAWDERHFGHACTILGRLARRDMGEGYLRESPRKALASILLPWFPQTLASVESRQGIAKALARESEELAWEVLCQLLPNTTSVSVGSPEPSWQEGLAQRVSAQKEEGVYETEYIDQVDFYAGLVIGIAQKDASRLVSLLNRLNSLPRASSDRLLAALQSEDVRAFSDQDKQVLWDALNLFHNMQERYDRYSGEEEAREVMKALELLRPEKPSETHRYLFSSRDFDLYESSNWRKEEENLAARRKEAVEKIYSQEDLEAVVGFAKSVGQPWKVGRALAELQESSIDGALLPALLGEENRAVTEFLRGFAWGRYQLHGLEWCDTLVSASAWSDKQKGLLLSFMPFQREVWVRAQEWLGGSQGEYWKRTDVRGEDGEDLREPIRQLVQCGRLRDAIVCLHEHGGSHPLDGPFFVRVMREAAASEESFGQMDAYHAVEVLKRMRGESTVSQAELAGLEFMYLRAFEDSREDRPEAMERELAENPGFFHEIMSLAYRPEGAPPREITKQREQVVGLAWSALSHVWAWPPGWKGEGFDGELWAAWWQGASEKFQESGHSLGIAHELVGNALGCLAWERLDSESDAILQSPKVAEAMDGSDQGAESLRRAFFSGVFGARGGHIVDETGEEERELGRKCRERAKQAESVGYPTYAQAWHRLARHHEEEARRIVDRRGPRGDDD